MSTSELIRPHILWITAEDICPNLGCYGDPDAVTPHLDQFATQSIRYNQTHSVHPCCSPSRSCLVTGVYPTRLGTFQHRGIMKVAPEHVRCFPTLLREAGYYTFNGMQGASSKLDYNFEPQDQPWNEVGAKPRAWRNRALGQPFFGPVNLYRSHQSQYGYRKVGTKDPKPAPAVHDPARVHVPPYHPDTPAIREIWAEYHDRISEVDAQFEVVLQQLKEDGLADDTIVFFFGDNGQGIPGGKIWLWEQGPHVPLMVHFPKKWAHLAPSAPGTNTDQLISFLDFAPTTLSLAGVPIPPWMPGTVFLGKSAGKPRRYVHAARDWHDGADFDTSRMVRDAQYHYIRNFMPHIGWDAIQYSWYRAPHMLEEWRQQAVAGKLKAGTRQACFFQRSKPSEELYDLKADPYQMHNLADEPRHQKTLQRLRRECERWMQEHHDLGLLSQHELYVRSERDSPYAMGQDEQRNPVKRLIAAANLANRREVSTIPKLLALLKDPDGALRRWGALGLLALGEKASPAKTALHEAALHDTAPDVRLTAAEALFALKEGPTALPTLLELLTHESNIIRNETLLALCRIGPEAKEALPHLSKALTGSRKYSMGSDDNLPGTVKLAQACLAVGENSPDKASSAPIATLRQTREKYL